MAKEMINGKELEIMEAIKIKSLECATERLKLDTETLQTEALEMSKKRQTVEWDIQRTEFAKYYEAQEIDKGKTTFNKLRDMVQASEKSDAALTARLQNLRQQKAELVGRTKQTKENIECLLKAKANADETKAQLQRENLVLKKRNAAIWLKLNKQKQDFDDQIDKFSTRLMSPALKRKQ